MTNHPVSCRGRIEPEIPADKSKEADNVTMRTMKAV
jgi:hypothetical protein